MKWSCIDPDENKLTVKQRKGKQLGKFGYEHGFREY